MFPAKTQLREGAQQRQNPPGKQESLCATVTVDSKSRGKCRLTVSRMGPKLPPQREPPLARAQLARFRRPRGTRTGARTIQAQFPFARPNERRLLRPPSRQIRDCRSPSNTAPQIGAVEGPPSSKTTINVPHPATIPTMGLQCWELSFSMRIPANFART